MEKKWEKLLQKVNQADNAMTTAIAKLEEHLVYKGFDINDEPVLDMATSHELILSWHFSEMYPCMFIEIMDRKGFISPEDF